MLTVSRTEQMKGHMARALENGVTKEEIGEMVTHLAFYCGWPAGMTAGLVAHGVFDQQK